MTMLTMTTDSVGKSEHLATEGFHPAVISPGSLNTAHSSSEIYNIDPLKSTFPFRIPLRIASLLECHSCALVDNRAG